MQTINNDFLEVSVAEQGGTLTSILDKSRNAQLLWQGSEDSWTGQDVVIFPFVGRMQDGWYTVDGKRYDMPIHGLCESATFELRELSQDRVVLGLRYSADTLVAYPFKFDFEVTRQVVDRTLYTTMKVVNLDDKPMYFGMGGHPAMALPAKEGAERDDLSGNYLDFGREYCPNNLDLFEGKYILGKSQLSKVSRLELTKELMDSYPTVLLCDDIPRVFDLVRADGVRVTFDITTAPILGLWSWENKGGYYCIEPWLATPDCHPVTRELKDKPYILSLFSGEQYQYTFSMTIR